MSLKQEHPGFFSLLSLQDQQPLQKLLEKWHSQVKNGHIKRVIDLDTQLPVVEICGSNINQNWLSRSELGVKLPVLVLLVKNLDKYFRLQVTVRDEDNRERVFIASNNQSITRVKPFQCSMPLQMESGWNQIVFDLKDYCKKAFGSIYSTCNKILVHANCRIARIYFNDEKKSQEEIPSNYKLFMRVQPVKI